MKSNANKQQHLTVQQLRYLLNTLEAGSVTESAKQLGISQSTLSEAIRQAENLTGFSILSRSRRGVEATVQGAKFLKRARRVTSEMESLERLYLNSDRTRERFVVSSLSFGIAWISLLTLSDLPEYSNLDITWHLDIASQIVDRVKNDEADLGLLNLTPGKDRPIKKMIEDSQLEFHPLLESTLYAIMDRSHPLANRSRVTVDELSEWPLFEFDQFVHAELLISLNERGSIISYPQPNSRKSEDHGIKTPTGVIVSPIRLVQNIADSRGYTVWCRYLPESFADDSAVMIPIDTKDTMTIGYVTKADAELSAPANKFIELMKDYDGRPGSYSADSVAKSLGLA